MDVLRRNTDYGFRIMANLAKHFDAGQLLSAQQLAGDGDFSYQLGCKLLQKLHKAKLVKSEMGPKGGFSLNKNPANITLMDIIKALQGTVRLNSCLLDGKGCRFKNNCGISSRLEYLQQYINDYLDKITLAELLLNKNGKGAVENG